MVMNTFCSLLFILLVFCVYNASTTGGIYNRLLHPRGTGRQQLLYHNFNNRYGEVLRRNQPRSDYDTHDELIKNVQPLQQRQEEKLNKLEKLFADIMLEDNSYKNVLFSKKQESNEIDIEPSMMRDTRNNFLEMLQLSNWIHRVLSRLAATPHEQQAAPVTGKRCDGVSTCWLHELGNSVHATAAGKQNVGFGPGRK
uniref:Calcitonin n=1 Tax=Ciona intestinalis TaxID=7719 RepID=F6YJH4_CIOIN